MDELPQLSDSLRVSLLPWAVVCSDIAVVLDMVRALAAISEGNVNAAAWGVQSIRIDEWCELLTKITEEIENLAHFR